MRQPTVHTEDYNGYRIEIIQDTDIDPPHKFADEFMEFVTWHRDFSGSVDGRSTYGDPEQFIEKLSGIRLDELPDNYISYNSGRADEMKYRYKGKWYNEMDIRRIQYDLANKENILLPVGAYSHSGVTIYEGHRSVDVGGWDSGGCGWIWASKDTFRKETGYSEGDLFSLDKDRTPVKGDHVRVVGVEYDRYGWGTVKQVDGGAFIVTHRGQGDRYPQEDFRCVRSEISEVMTDRAAAMLRGWLRTWDDYLTGRVYGYVIHTLEDGESLDDHVGSCWGFYPDHDDKMGYAYCLSTARSEVDSIDAQEAEKALERLQTQIRAHSEKIKGWIKGRIPLIYRTPLNQ